MVEVERDADGAAFGIGAFGRAILRMLVGDFKGEKLGTLLNEFLGASDSMAEHTTMVTHNIVRAVVGTGVL